MDDAPTIFARVYPLTILVVVGLGIPVVLLVLNRLGSRFAHGHRESDPGKQEPYECGLTATSGGAGERFPVKFYLVAMLFLAFDVEVAFLYPWALHFNEGIKNGGWGMIWLLVAFLVVLEVAYLYLWRKGALDWDK
ncbi:MAG: NADH-quinone oxidoreductase subunit A [Planctomycetota bacterium]